MAFAAHLILVRIVTVQTVLSTRSISLNSKEKPIINGHVYITQNIEDYPYIGSLENNGKPRCTATIIKPQFVLTAYFCAVNVYVEDLRVRAGPIDAKSGTDKFIQIKEIENIKYREEEIEGSSIAVLKLKSPFELNKFVNVINLGTTEASVNEKLTVIGFQMGQCDERSNYLLLGKMRIMENVVCAKRLGILTEAQICTSTDAFTNRAIRGEAGGPLVKRISQNIDNDLLVGIVVLTRMERQNQFSPVGLTVHAGIAKLHSWILAAIESLDSS